MPFPTTMLFSCSVKPQHPSPSPSPASSPLAIAIVLLQPEEQRVDQPRHHKNAPNDGADTSQEMPQRPPLLLDPRSQRAGFVVDREARQHALRGLGVDSRYRDLPRVLRDAELVRRDGLVWRR